MFHCLPCHPLVPPVCPTVSHTVVDLNASKAQQVAQELQLKGARSIAIQADVSSKQDCNK